MLSTAGHLLWTCDIQFTNLKLLIHLIIPYTQQSLQPKTFSLDKWCNVLEKKKYSDFSLKMPLDNTWMAARVILWIWVHIEISDFWLKTLVSWQIWGIVEIFSETLEEKCKISEYKGISDSYKNIANHYLELLSLFRLMKRPFILLVRKLSNLNETYVVLDK